MQKNKSLNLTMLDKPLEELIQNIEDDYEYKTNEIK